MKTLQHKFVEFIPENLEDDVVYISIPFATVVHKCVCGCGNEVVTPLSPTDWELSYNGETVSLSPSIGNWNFPCRSHYWIVKNKVRHSVSWDKEKIDAGRKADQKKKNKFFGRKKRKPD